MNTLYPGSKNTNIATSANSFVTEKNKNELIQNLNEQIQNNTFKVSPDYSDRVNNFKSVAVPYQWQNLINVVKGNSQPPFEKHPAIKCHEDLRNKSKIVSSKKCTIDGNEVEFIPFERNKKKTLLICPLSTDGRIYIKVRINGIPVTFYSSTGKAKKTLKSGMFYPTLGINHDEMAWINKTDSIDMAMYYGSPILTKVARLIDRKFGNPNDFTKEIEQATYNISQSNTDVEQFINSGRNTYENTKSNLESIKGSFIALAEQIENSKRVV